jgi:VCBS repeat-containing protein
MQAQITGDVIGSVTEKGGVANGTAGVATATGNLDVTDPDSPETFEVQSSVAKTYGTFSIDATGAWTYTLDDTNAQVQALPAGGTLHELVTVSAADGTTQQLDITITGANDAATITGTSTGSLMEDVSLSVSSSLVVQDVDAGQAVFQSVSPGDLQGDYGAFTFNAGTGAWDYTVDRVKANALAGGQVVHDTLQVTSADGTASTTIDVSVTGTAEGGPTLDMRDSSHSLNMDGLTFAGFSIVTDPLPTSFSWHNADGFWTIRGTGFLYDADGHPTAGTIKSIDVTNGSGQPGLLITELSLSASQFAGWVVANTPQSINDFLKAILSESDTIWGNALADQLKGGALPDTIHGEAGNDILTGGSGTDHLNGGAGNDTVSYLDDGTDAAGVSTRGVSVNLQSGLADDNWNYTDFLGGIENVIGSNRADSIALGYFAGTAYGMLGNDTMYGSVEGDTLDGGGGNDSIAARDGDDSLIGGAGNDTLQGENGNDTVAGGSGIDTLNGGTGSDTADYRDFGVDGAGLGTQGVTVQLSSGAATDNWGNSDTLTSIENVNGSNLADTITGDGNANNLSGFGGNDTLDGGGGNDWLRGGSGNDTIYGNAGTDTVDYGYDGFDSAGAPTQGVIVSLPFAEATDNWGNHDTLISIENVNGSALDDTIGGDGVANVLFGLAGNDTITAGGGDDILDGGAGDDSLSASIGNDTLRGGSGNDTLTGGTGSDTFVVGAGDGNDTVTDFENGIDKIQAGTLGTSFADVTVTQDGGDVVVGFGSGSPTLRLKNTSTALIDASDFMFGVAAQITGDITGSVTEKSGVANGTAGVATATGNLDVTDSDGPETFITQSAVAKTYGTFSIDATGAWSYTLDENNADVQALKSAGILHELVTVSAADGTTQVIDIRINGANDAAVFSGTVAGSVTEKGGVANGTAGTATATGTVAVTDVDSPATLLVQSNVAKSYGTFSIDAAGAWAYTLNDNNATVQALGAGQTLHELVTIMTVDGSTQQIDITITGANDAAVVTGTMTGSVTEKGGVANGTAGVATATGTVSAIDVDGAATFVAQNAAAKTYGTFSINAAGAWSYALDDSNADVQALNVGGTLQEVVTVVTADGTARQMAITVNGANDAAVITGTATGSVTEKGGIANATAGVAAASGTLSATDVDSPATFAVQSTVAKAYGTFSIDAAGSWTYALDDSKVAVEALNAGGTLHELVTVATADGTTRQIDITINGADDIVETAGDTDLIQMGNQYLLRDSGGAGPLLKFGGLPVAPGQFAGWTIVGAEKTASGYQVAWKFGADQYVVWNTDSSGNYTGSATATVPGSDISIQQAEVVFQQDLNGNGQTGLTTTVIETAGDTDLVQVGIQYFLRDSGGAGPSLKRDGAAVVAGQFGAWTVIGAEQTGSTYQVAWKFGDADQYVVWNLDSNGNYTGNATPISRAVDAPLQIAETAFQQNLNGDTQTGPTTTPIETAGDTDLVQVANQYFLRDGGGAGPSLKFGEAPVAPGQFTGWTIVGAEKTASGYQVAWKFGADQFVIWNLDSRGNYTSNVTGVMPGSDISIQQAEVVLQQDLNGNGQTGLTTTPIETAGATDLVQVGNQYFLHDSGGVGPSLKRDGAAVVTGQFGAWTVIGAEQTGSTYQVAWKFGDADQYVVWNLDSSGNYTGNATAMVSGADPTLEALELVFQQNLNGDGTTGILTTPIETAGSTDLVQVANQFFLQEGGTGPSMKMGGVVITASQFGDWTPIGAEKTESGGYQVAWKFGSADQYVVWNLDNSGNYTGNATATVHAADLAIQQAELTFQQNLNGDTITGPVTATIETAGSTDLVQMANQFFLQEGGTGPSVKMGGVVITAGQFGDWTPIGAEKTESGGYQIAWKFGSADQYVVWNLDSSGNYTGNATATVHAADLAIQQAELTFQQNLNGDTITGPVTATIETAGSTDLVQVANQFFLQEGGTGPSVKMGGATITAGQFGDWTPIGAEETANGYLMAWKLGSADQYTVWNLDSSGNYASNATAVVSGADPTLQALELAFQQDLIL